MEKKLKCPYCGRSMELKNGKTLDYWYSCTECDVDTPAARGRALAYQRAVEWTLAVLGTCDALSDALGIRKTHPMETVPLETLLGEVKKLQQTLGNRVLTLDEVTADAEKEDWSFIWIERKYDEKYALISVPTRRAGRGTNARHTAQAVRRRPIGRKVGRLAGCMGIRHAKETHRCLKG